MSKVVRNSILLYGRSIIILVLSLYSSRLLLSYLGVEDFGLYGLVGGVVSLFASLKVLFSFAVQRYLSFAKGEGDLQKEREVFNVSFYLHICIALLFAVIVGIVGFWLIDNKLNIPTRSVNDAYFVFVFSLLTAVTTILITPYSASIIANERMNVFAWITLFDAVLKILVILALPILPFYPIRTYAVLLFSLEFLNGLLYLYNCRKFPECKLGKLFNKKLFKEMTSFAGWDFAGNTAWALINGGVNMILNIFGGVAINAARGVAYQVKNAVIQLVNNVTVASRPYIIKQAASDSKEVTFNSICLMARALFVIMAITSLPLIVYTEGILGLWLIETPDYAVSFVRLSLVWNVVRTVNTPIDLAFTAYGKMKTYQIFNSLALLLNLPLAYLFLYLGYPYYYAMLTFVIVELIDITVNLIVCHKVIQFDVNMYFRKVVIPNIINTIIYIFIGYLFFELCSTTNMIVTISFMAVMVIIAAFATYCSLSKNEKDYVTPMIKKIINRIK